jgi:adsorption protein B
VQVIFAHQRAVGIEFAGVVLRDSEDVLHPLELKFFNFLLSRKDMIQVPVASLERGLSEWVAGTYVDEFAESHGKEMLVRESISATVPSAGVGTCFSRRALAALVGTTHNHPFNTESLTEDYDVGMRLQALATARSRRRCGGSWRPFRSDRPPTPRPCHRSASCQRSMRR